MTTQGDDTRNRIVQYIEQYDERNGYGPTLEQIAAAVGVNYSTAQWHLSVLEQQGRIVHEPYKARSVEVVK